MLSNENSKKKKTTHCISRKRKKRNNESKSLANEECQSDMNIEPIVYCVGSGSNKRGKMVHARFSIQQRNNTDRELLAEKRIETIN